MATVAHGLPRNHAVRAAVHRHGRWSAKGIGERAFTFAFRGLVYPQIWEDPEADLEALALTPDSRVIAIASGGCNVLSYLTADPAAITAVDLNPAHVALNRLKNEAARRLSQEEFRRFFAHADDRRNVAVYRAKLHPHLDAATRGYWDRRAPVRPRIEAFARGFYRGGLLGRFIGVAHLLARLHGVDPRAILAARDRAEQRRIFDEQVAPLFDRPLIRWLGDRPAALYGLGIAPAQFGELTGGARMAEVLRRRLETLACDFDLKDNYFAWQAFARGYGRGPDAPLPPYLQPANFALIRERAARIDIRHANLTEHLATLSAGALDRFVLLDAQDWMTDDQLTALWTQITRVAAPGARMLYRTAGIPDIVPGRVPAPILSRWTYQAAEAKRLSARDRSAVYGATHLYVLGDAA
jgi:S-adenosylmethionine-diacylglycerol 3-amino-3-carboxypropyl transferase